MLMFLLDWRLPVVPDNAPVKSQVLWLVTTEGTAIPEDFRSHLSPP